jgi:hypothetical protein
MGWPGEGGGLLLRDGRLPEGTACDRQGSPGAAYCRGVARSCCEAELPGVLSGAACRGFGAGLETPMVSST